MPERSTRSLASEVPCGIAKPPSPDRSSPAFRGAALHRHTPAGHIRPRRAVRPPAGSPPPSAPQAVRPGYFRVARMAPSGAASLGANAVSSGFGSESAAASRRPDWSQESADCADREPDTPQEGVVSASRTNRASRRDRRGSCRLRSARRLLRPRRSAPPVRTGIRPRRHRTEYGPPHCCPPQRRFPRPGDVCGNGSRPRALDPMPASQAKITLRTGRPAACGDMPAALCGSFPTAGSPSVSVLDARRIKGAATSSDTAAEITTPSRTMSVLPLGAIASTERMLPATPEPPAPHR